MENFERINNIPEDIPVPEESVSVFEKGTQSNSENWANEGELLQKKNTEEGNKRYLSGYIEAFNEIKNLESFE